MNKPNIFKMATKELSQDGFLSWLLQWADPNNQHLDAELHQCAKSFVKLLVSKQIDLPSNFDVNKVSVEKQRGKIDIWAEINDNILIIIEDKTSTGQHSNQLERYKEFAENFCRENGYQLVCLYVKTGSQSKSSLEYVAKQKYAIIGREDLLNFFDQYQIKNDIYSDFVDRIKSLEESENSFETLPIGEWYWDSWVGFYKFLEGRIDGSDWQYVSNPAGGFLGFWWHGPDWDYSGEDDKCTVYLQLEQGNLCLKISDIEDEEGEANPSEIRNDWHSVVMERAKAEGITEIHRPARFGRGETMTVAVVERKDWLGADEDTVDKEKVIERLKKYEGFLDRCLS